MKRQSLRHGFIVLAMVPLFGCGAGEVGGRAIDLVGHGQEGVLPLRQSNSCGGGTSTGGTGQDPYGSYGQDPYANGGWSNTGGGGG